MTEKKARIAGAIILILGMLLLCGTPLLSQDNASQPVNHPLRFAVSPPLRELAKLPQPVRYGLHEANPPRSIRLPLAGENDQDGCTFWYTTEYYTVIQTFDWSTRLGTINFANCH